MQRLAGTWTATKKYHGFLRSADGSFDTFTVEGELTESNTIRDKGVVAGGYFSSGPGFLFGYLRTTKGKLKPFDSQPSATVFIGGINNAGQIAGTFWDSNVHPHGYLGAKDRTLTTFDAPGKPDTEANAINAGGVITGDSFDNSNTAHGFVRAIDGTFVQFDAPGAGKGGSAGTYVLAVNKSGTAVGYLKTVSLSEQALVRGVDGTITVFGAPGRGTEAGKARAVPASTRMARLSVPLLMPPAARKDSCANRAARSLSLMCRIAGPLSP